MRFQPVRRGASLLDYGLIAVVLIIASIGALSAVGGLAINPFAEVGSAFGEGEEVAEGLPTVEPTLAPTPAPTPTPTPTPTPPPPATTFTFTPTSPVVGAPIQFTGPSAGVDSWAWSFGGGATSTVQNPTHTYSTAGAKTVSLTVTGPGGSAGSSQNITVAAPVAYSQAIMNMGPAAYWRLNDSAPVTAATYNTPGTNVLLNSSFETAANWSICCNAAIAKLVTAPAYDGTRTAMFDEAAGWHYMAQSLTLAQGSYAVTGWVKAQNFVLGTGGARFRNETATGTIVTSGSFGFPAGTYDWQLVSYIIQVTSSSWSGNMIISNNYGGSGGSGDLWVDQVMIRPLRAADSIGANHGTIFGAPTLGAAGLLTGDSNKAIAFNGTSQYIRVTDSATLDLFSGTNPWTIAVWINHTPPANYPGIVEYTNIRFRSQAADLLLFRSDGVTTDALYSNPLTPGTHFVVARFNGTTLKLFVDGVPNPNRYGTTGASTLSAPAPSSPLYIGSDSGPGTMVNGRIDEPAIFGRALTDAEIAALYVAGTYAP